MIDRSGDLSALGKSAVLDGEALVVALTRRFRTSVEDATVDARTFSILKPANSDDLIREEDFVKDERLPYWADVWQSSIILAGKLLELKGHGKTALELGCGVGLSTLAATSAGFDVLSTDYYEDALDGLRVKIVTFQDGDDDSIEIRYDTPEGRGSFWETLRRQRRTPQRATR